MVTFDYWNKLLGNIGKLDSPLLQKFYALLKFISIMTSKKEIERKGISLASEKFFDSLTVCLCLVEQYKSN